jgi:hypothetical protein
MATAIIIRRNVNRNRGRRMGCSWGRLSSVANIHRLRPKEFISVRVDRARRRAKDTRGAPCRMAMEATALTSRPFDDIPI